jgi:hypothetical protein
MQIALTQSVFVLACVCYSKVESGLIRNDARGGQWEDRACVVGAVFEKAGSTVTACFGSVTAPCWSEGVALPDKNVITEVLEKKGQVTAGQILHRKLGLNASNWQESSGRGFCRAKLIADAMERLMSNLCMTS